MKDGYLNPQGFYIDLKLKRRMKREIYLRQNDADMRAWEEDLKRQSDELMESFDEYNKRQARTGKTH